MKLITNRLLIQLPALLILMLLAPSAYSAYKMNTLNVDGHQLNVTHWNYGDVDSIKDSKTTIILLSGPNDHWNSDSALFARLAPKLAKTHKVISIDRPGQILNIANANIGYAQFGGILGKVFDKLKIKKMKIIAFASSNIALNQYFMNNINHSVESVLMIDPDVLLPYSIGRYTNDALPFKKNRDKYLAYIDAGKYAARALQKNTTEITQIKEMTGNDLDTDWKYLNLIFSNRLKINNLKNLFSEIANYQQDLDLAFHSGFPTDIPLTIIDTDFEQAYIETSKDNKEKEGLRQWKIEATKYYTQLANDSVKGKYLSLKTQQHLLPFSQPDLLVKLLLAN